MWRPLARSRLFKLVRMTPPAVARGARAGVSISRGSESLKAGGALRRGGVPWRAGQQFAADASRLSSSSAASGPPYVHATIPSHSSVHPSSSSSSSPSSSSKPAQSEPCPDMGDMGGDFLKDEALVQDKPTAGATSSPSSQRSTPTIGLHNPFKLGMTSSQWARLWLCSAIPFVGFGMVDNTIMIMVSLHFLPVPLCSCAICRDVFLGRTSE
uniref:Uncharacterized protein n=1 Tax=Chromera velia CCMP2878 TaxID=1169474 RepID=A0A0G4HU29_9ALVE|eukprot:Cvel_31691.t1-p1 / transcript=Cvel_31691.t1 / gene=Cvel_31691 / organism=Chromera_velia_CCMP2878 / gene_product=hypothetical protein / transcript_product=hypothetical protein / location=Cvel_scaffold4770:6625-7257(+) / protein_length=211 / sequence_SO=supercontig / SO=protein_coding / is_pseudo=false